MDNILGFQPVLLYHIVYITLEGEHYDISPNSAEDLLGDSVPDHRILYN